MPYLAPASGHTSPPAEPTGIDLRLERAVARPPAVVGNVSPAPVSSSPVPTSGVPATSVDPFRALDQEMARAVAATLAEALRHYATPALIPLVVEQMAQMLREDGRPDDG